MLGLLNLLIGGVACLVSDTQNSIEDTERRELAKKSGSSTYIDHKGATRNVHNNHIEHVSIDYYGTGDVIVHDLTAHTKVNLSEQKRQQEVAEIKKAPKTEYPQTIQINKDEHHRDMVRGYRYKDVYTGKIYVKRWFRVYRPSKLQIIKDLLEVECIAMVEMYIDINSREIVGPVEDSYNKFKEGERKIDFKQLINNIRKYRYNKDIFDNNHDGMDCTNDFYKFSDIKGMYLKGLRWEQED